MTKQKHLKQRVRSRMEKTGEKYAAARRQVVQETPASEPKSLFPWHFAGKVPATTCLRGLLAHAGVRAPHTGEPFSEPLLFAIAGGIGIGVFSFFYEKEKSASFFIAGRHSLHDDAAYLQQALSRFGIKPIIKETSGAKGAEQALRAALAEPGVCIAWVDAALLPHRAMPPAWSGGGYHVVTVYQIDNEAGTALIGDLANEPIRISLADLSVARARIKKQKNRLLSIPPSSSPKELADLVHEGLRACHRGLSGQTGYRGYQTNFSLEGIRLWAERMHGSRDKESWERVFAPPRLWRGLVSVYDFIEHYGAGGGLSRPLFAQSLREAGDALKDASLRPLADRYSELGQQWSQLATAALPDDLPAFREAKVLHARKAQLTRSGANPEEIRGVWGQIGELGRQVREKFPLTDAECAELRVGLQQRIRAIYEEEMAAHAALGAVCA